jgi:hypothetical protein
MSLSPINCPSCGTKHNWFTENPDQRCQECRENNQEASTIPEIIETTSEVISEEPQEEINEDNLEEFMQLEEEEEIDDPTDTRTPAEKKRERKERLIKELQEKKAKKRLTKRKLNLRKAADRFHRRRKKIANSATPIQKLKAFDVDVHAQELEESKRNKSGINMKIVPDIEKILFPYYIAGASLRSIEQQFGDRFGFGLGALSNARDFYKWEERRKAIRGTVMNDNALQMAERTKDYMAFFDDLLSEAMIRFKDNSSKGNNSNPFNTLKVSNIKDIKDLTELMVNLANGGVKKVEVESKGGIKLSDKKASRLLEILSEDEDEEENQ